MSESNLSFEEWKLVEEILEAFEGGDWPLARALWESTGFDNEQIIESWSRFNARQRAYLKKAHRNYLVEE